MSDIVELLQVPYEDYLRGYVIEDIKAEAADEILRLRKRLAEADEANRRVSDENEKLRAALKPFTKRQPKDAPDNQTVWVETTVKNLRAAAKAYRETEECSTSST